jgi:type I restriction enzyme, S subunit
MTGPSGSQWACATLGEVAEIQTGIAKNTEARFRRPVSLPYLRVANVQDGYLDLSEITNITLNEEDVPRYSLRRGDVLLTEGGDFDKLGRGTVWRGTIAPCLHQNHIFAVRARDDLLLPEFLSAYCGSDIGKRYFLSCSKQTTNLASINSSQLREMPIRLPPLAEQRRIVVLLDAWNRAIEISTSLLAARRTLFDQVISRLARQRWEPVRLGDLGQWVGGGTPSKSTQGFWRKGDIPWASPKDMTSWRISETEDRITREAVEVSSTRIVPAGAVLVVTRSGILRTKVPVAVAEKEMAINQDLKALAVDGPWSGRLIALLLRSSDARLRRATMKTGTTVESIDLDALKAFRLSVPIEPSEVAQAEGLLVRSAIGIDLLGARSGLYRLQRGALTQKLLGGEWRLKGDLDRRALDAAKISAAAAT